MVSTWSLVGRDTELAEAAGAMDAGAGGVLLVGPAGVGKTRLATACLGLAEAREWATAVVRANRSAATIPYGAFVPLLPMSISAQESRADALRRISTGILESAGERTLMVVVDDAHELDESSAALLLLLATTPGVFPVVTVRSGDQAPEAVTALWKDELLARIDVAELSPQAAAELITEAVAGPVDGGTAHALWSISGGNPLFLRELVIGALDAGTLQPAGGMWRLRGALSPSTRLGEVVGLRLGALEPGQREAIEIVSMGEPVGIEELTQLAPPESIDELERRGLVETLTEGGWQEVRMAHPLYGEVLRAGLPARRRAEICRLLADVVEARGLRRRDDTLRVALWRLDGGGDESPDLLLEAARQAWFASDILLTERFARAAWEAGGRPEAGRQLGEALDMRGAHAKAEEVLRAAEAAPAPEDERARLALARSSNLFRGLGRAADADAVLVAAEHAVHDHDLHDELVAQRATHALFAGRLAEVFALTEPMLERPDDRPFVMGALSAAVALALAGRTEQAIAVADRAFEARLALGDQLQIARPGVYLVARALALQESGQLAEGAEFARLGYDGAVEQQVRDGQAWFSVILGRIALVQGRPVSAARWFREAAVIYGDANHGAARWGYGGLAHALALVGDLDGADTALADLDAEPPTTLRMMDPDIERGRAWVLAQRGELSVARALLRAAADEAAADAGFALEAAALHDLARLGDADAVMPRVTELATIIDGRLMPARVQHVQALQTREAAHFDAAADAFEDIGADLLAAEAAAAASRGYTRKGLSRRAKEAAQRSARLAAQCQGARTPALVAETQTTPLTRREREVANLAARGLSSREIADKLFVSARTVENHLQRVYEKLGVRGRAELADVLNVDAE